MTSSQMERTVAATRSSSDDMETNGRLHLGCGLTAPAGWTNVDGSYQVVLAKRPLLKWAFRRLGLLSEGQARIPWPSNIIRAALTRPLRFSSRSFSAVYSSHTLEHLYRDHALDLMRECFRVLAPGGTCRIVVPDLQFLAEQYVAAARSDASARAHEFMTRLRVHATAPESGPVGFYRRLTAYHQHKWMYDAGSLVELFVEAGFPDPRQCGYLDSAIPSISEVEDPGRMLNGEGIAVEAQRPSDSG
jgi:SAM-dependent methyltransferase